MDRVITRKQGLKFQRFRSYDYTRGVVLFVTITLGHRAPILSRVVGESVELLPAGKILDEVIRRECTRHPELIHLRKFVIMPDHLHLRVYLEKDQKYPLKVFGQFVYNIKRWTTYRCAQEGLVVDWQENYHDRICLTREIWKRVDRYIGYNPLKWSLMHGENPPLKVHEMIDKPLIPEDELWSGVGRTDLLDGKARVCVLQLSRRIPESDFDAILNYLRRVAKAGFIFASTFISPLERQLFDLLGKSKLPIIHAVPDELEMVYRPKGDEPRLFAEDRYLMLSRLAAPGLSRAEAWHSLNRVLGEKALQNGGLFLYLKSCADCVTSSL